MDDKGPLVFEWGKLALLTISLLCSFALIFVALFAMKSDDPRFAVTLSFATGTVGIVIGYVTGNGRLASRSQDPVPAIGRAADPVPE